MNADLPSLEARMSAQEHKTAILHTRVEDLSRDINASYKQISEYFILDEQQTEARFGKIETRLDTIEATMATKQDIAEVRAEMASVKTEMASMEGRLLQHILQDIAGVRTEMVSMEGRILDAFKQLAAIVDPRRTSQ